MSTLDHLSSRLAAVLRVLLPVTLVAVFLYDLVYSWHWPVVWDSAVIHYVNYLIDHGLRPYRDISDSNMPGTYLIERWAMHLFGRGDLGWRLFDASLSLLLTLSFVVIAGRGRRLAGIFGGLLFAILHSSEGPNFAVEREQVMTTLVALALAALLTGERRRSPRWLLIFGLASGLATSIKPTAAPFALVLLLIVLFSRRRPFPLGPALLYTIVGLFLAVLPVAAFFLRTHSFADFLLVTRTLLPSYVASHQSTYGAMLYILLPRNLLLLLPFGLALIALNHDWSLEHTLTAAAMLLGALSFFLQHKGILYHRHPFVAFLLLLLGLEFFSGLVAPTPTRRLLASAGLLLTLLVSIPHYVVELHRSIPYSSLAFTHALTIDLRAMGTSRLNGNVECFDLTDGCFSALYHLDIEQHDGFTGDLLFFSPDPSPVRDFYRQQFWAKEQARPIDVFVISNEWFQVGHTYRKLAAWPRFQQFLAQNYTPVLTRSFPIPGYIYNDPNTDPGGYRIYVRNSSPLASDLIPLSFAPQQP